MTDPIADMLTRIRNAYAARREEVTVPYSRLKLTLAGKLAQAGFIGEVKTSGEEVRKTLVITLRYHNNRPLLTHLKRISRPSVRKYAPVHNISAALSGKGLSILSTSKGLLTDREARKAGVGGEVICQVW